MDAPPLQRVYPRPLGCAPASQEPIYKAWKVLRLICGLAVLACSLISFIASTLHDERAKSSLGRVSKTVWLVVFALTAISLEDWALPASFRRGLFQRRLFYYFRFLFLPPGRGYLYLLMGCLLLVKAEDQAACNNTQPQQPHTDGGGGGGGGLDDFTGGGAGDRDGGLAPGATLNFDSMLGVAMVVLGFGQVVSGELTACQLRRLKFCFSSEEDVRRRFRAQSASSRVPGELDASEFKRFCYESFGMELSVMVLDTAVNLIDADRNGLVNESELLTWWLVDL